MVKSNSGEDPKKEEFSEESMNKVLEHIASIKKLMPFLTNLTPGQRMSLPKVNDKRKPFVEKALYYAKTNRELFPAGIDIEAMDKNMVVFNRTGTVDRELSKLVEMISDTYIFRGAGIYKTARNIYKATDLARQTDIPGVDYIYNDLAKHYRRDKNNESDVENDQPEEQGRE